MKTQWTVRLTIVNTENELHRNNQEFSTNDWDVAKRMFWHLANSMKDSVENYRLEWINNEDADLKVKIIASLMKF